MSNESLEDTVIDGNYCIGCGACSYINPEKFSLEMDKYGMYTAKASDENIISELNGEDAENVCPFSNNSPSEDQLADERFPDHLEHDNRIGKYISCYAGHVTVGEYREKGSSGGFGKWLLHELLDRDIVDYVVQVVPKQEDDELFSYKVCENAENILEGSKSAYHPVNLEESLNFIRETEGRFAITALPCFSKALQSIAKQDDVIDDRVDYILGLVCGGLKARTFAEAFGWQLGVHPNDLAEIEFRGDSVGDDANQKGVYAIDKSGKSSPTKSSRDLVGGNWGHTMFQYKACDYCDDIVGETADVSFGDAWLEGYRSDLRGNNIVITRDPKIDKIVQESIEKGILEFDVLDADDVVKSQSSGIRHRREGLAYRLHKKNQAGEWAPEKRIEPKKTGSRSRDRNYDKRIELRKSSHEAFLEAKQTEDLGYFIRFMNEKIKEYEKARTSRIKRARGKIGDYLAIIGLKKIAANYYRKYRRLRGDDFM